MKKLFLPVVLAIICCFSLNCFAVSGIKNPLKDFSFGIKLGATYPNSNIQNPDNIYLFPENANIGFSGGLNANYYFIKNILAVQLEVNYMLICTEYDINSWDTDGNILPSFTQHDIWHVLQVPLLLKATLPLDMPLKPFITCGPALDIQLIGASTTTGSILRTSLITGIGTDYVLESGNIINLEVRADWRIAGGMGIMPYTVFSILLGYNI